MEESGRNSDLSQECRFHEVIQSLRSSVDLKYLSLLDEFSGNYEAMHKFVDEIFLLNLRHSIDIQHIPRDDEEE